MSKPRSSVELAVGVVAVVSAAVTLAFVAYAFVCSPQNPVAAEIGFEAQRVARGFALYVDPWKGAWENGAPPSRYYVLYTPIFPWIVGKLAALVGGGSPSLDTIRLVGRVIAVSGWLVVHVVPVWLAPKENRRTTAIAALLGASVYFVSRHAASMSPDALATALLVAGVARSVRRGEVDPVSAMLLIAAPFVKPSCLGGVAGAALVHLALRQGKWLRSLVAAVVCAVGLAIVCHLASDGQWLANIEKLDRPAAHAHAVDPGVRQPRHAPRRAPRNRRVARMAEARHVARARTSPRQHRVDDVHDGEARQRLALLARAHGARARHDFAASSVRERLPTRALGCPCIRRARGRRELAAIREGAGACSSPR